MLTLLDSRQTNTAPIKQKNLSRVLALSYFAALVLIVFLNDYKPTQHFFTVFAEVENLDKFAHFFVMGCFSFFANLAFSARNLKIAKYKYLMGSTVVLVLATLEETSQLFVAGRNFEFSDMLCNTLGILILGECARIVIKLVSILHHDPDGIPAQD